MRQRHFPQREKTPSPRRRWRYERDRLLRQPVALGRIGVQRAAQELLHLVVEHRERRHEQHQDGRGEEDAE